MPSISTCQDIIVYMHSNEDNVPHIHATYQGCESVVTLPDCEILKGGLPANKMKSLQAWVEQHKDELMAN
ncbi:MAG: DUF4160 domain-containing protein [Candidatus Electrothrix sp. AR4]|nr:DUF4160 domain-containing protein [Candidatus Electrothrix sp. AR4]